MTSTTTSTLRPAPSSLTVPSTQNTAPVLSYNCLYTHDLRRKAKRWQDGFLKYHTFNKRIMLYDVPRNFIGDTHWREPQPIQDGDELELEKGVLIQVGEEVKAERTETDLTELLGKRKSKPAQLGPKAPLPAAFSTPLRPQPSSTSYITPSTATSTLTSQLRPKTLNALLGKPKGPVGRATIPSRSPAEQRRGKENHPVDGTRSPKRRRLLPPADSSPSGPSPVGSYTTTMRPITSPSMTLTRPLVVSKATTSCDPKVSGKALSAATLALQTTGMNKKLQERTIDPRTDMLSPDDVEIIENPHPVHAPVREKRRKLTSQEEGTGIRVRPRGRKDAPDPGKKNQARSTHVSQGYQPMHENTSPVSEDYEDEPRPENRLRIALSKPRRKLMYRDLLPQKSPPQDIVQSVNSKSSSKKASHRRSSKSRAKQAEPSLAVFHQAQQDRLDARLSRRKKQQTIVEDPVEEPLLPLREDEGEYMYTPDKSPAPDEDAILESLFLSQSSLDECVPNASSLHVGQPKDPPETEDPPVQLDSSQHIDVDADSHLPDGEDLHDGHQIAENPETLDPTSHTEDPPPNDPRSNEDITTSPQAAESPKTPDPLLVCRAMLPPGPVNPIPEPGPTPKSKPEPPSENPTKEPPPRPNSKPETIKAAMPPQPLSRSFQRSSSDPSTLIEPNTSHIKRTSGLLRSYSNGFAPPSLHNQKPPQPQPQPRPSLHINATNLPITSNTNSMDEKDTELIPDSRPGSAKEQVVEPWSREAFDLFGFEGTDKRIGTGDGVKNGGGGGVVRGEDGWLVASQGFV
ncbi:MAG: hypothetical protein Q9168_004134 [Polycauliona sp. 1 TL-2023]